MSEGKTLVTDLIQDLKPDEKHSQQRVRCIVGEEIRHRSALSPKRSKVRPPLICLTTQDGTPGRSAGGQQCGPICCSVKGQQERRMFEYWYILTLKRILWMVSNETESYCLAGPVFTVSQSRSADLIRCPSPFIILGSWVAQRSKALHLSAKCVTTDLGSITGCITTGRDWESHRAVHNWSSVVLVRVWPG